nr:cation:proton antiporter [uncultured Friedmanniella sp.]
MHELHLIYAVVGIASVLLALVSRQVRRLPVTEPLVATLLGVVVGPAVLGLLVVEQSQRDVVLLEGSRLLLALSVTAAALRFPASSLRPLARSVALLLLIVMPVAALAAGAAALLLGLPLALALVVGACLSPTDPVLASSVVSGEPAEENLPARVRRVLTAESGANDGLALPLVGIAVVAVLPATRIADAAPRLMWEVLGGTGIGITAGVLAGLGLRAATRHRDLAPGPELVYTLLLAVAVLGVSRLAHTGGVLAVFIAALAYNWCIGNQERESESRVDEAVNRYAVLPLFLVFEAVLPWRQWMELGPLAVVFVIAVLLLRRLPWVLLLSRPLHLPRHDAVFTGWFGPMGVSAIFYLAHSIHEGVTDSRLFATGTLAIAVSVLAFGISAAPGTKVYARSRTAQQDGD